MRLVALNATFLLLLSSQTLHAQAYKDATGFTQLQAEIGAGLEDGAGILVGQVEGPAVAGAYLPDAANTQFSGKTFTDGTGTNTGSLGHATTVGLFFYGNSSSFTPGVTSVTGYDADDWLNNVTGIATAVAPRTQNFSVMNHSYILNGASESIAVELNRRMDFLAERDNVTMVVGANNGSTSAVPQIWAHSYNTITVGLTDGGHSHGLTSFDGAGRVKPEIVAPHGTAPNNSFTSFATAMVSSAAVLLRQQGQNSGNPNAIRNEVTKAVLLAGATKDEFPGWSNSATQPLDLTFGAGELNIYNSYHILGGGEFDGSLVAPATLIESRGWDYNAQVGAGESYFYDIELNAPLTEASIILNWNAQISDADAASGGILDYDTFELANLDLRIYDSSSSFMGALVSESISSVDNLEHLYVTGLSAGRYTIAVDGLSGLTDYALAWQFTAVPEPGLLPLGLATLTFFRRRRCRSIQLSGKERRVNLGD